MSRRVGVVGAVVIAVLAFAASPAFAGGRCHYHHQKPSLSISGDFSFFCCTHPNARTYVVSNDGGGKTGKLTAALSFDAGAPGQAFAITKDGCSGKSLRGGRSCSIEITWLVGPDTLATLTVKGKNASVSSPEFLGVAVP